MTPRERQRAQIINGSRRKRIARGSGTSVEAVNRLLKQFAQMRIAEAEGTLRSIRIFLLEEADRAWRTVAASGELSIETRIDMRLATTYTIRHCAEVVDNAFQLAGSSAIFNDKAFERRFRDMHAVTQHIQARDDHYERVGRFLLGLQPDLNHM